MNACMAGSIKEVPACTRPHLPLALSFHPICCATTVGPPCELMAFSRSLLQQPPRSQPASPPGKALSAFRMWRPRPPGASLNSGLHGCARAQPHAQCASATRGRPCHAVPCKPQAEHAGTGAPLTGALSWLRACSSPAAGSATAALAAAQSTAPARPPARQSPRSSLHASQAGVRLGRWAGGCP